MDSLVLGSKVLIMGLLFVLSMVNAYVKFIAVQPRKFLGESAIVGLASALSFAFIASTRGRLQVPEILGISSMAFLIFFVFHLFMEMSGFNQGSIDPSKLGGKQQKQFATFKSKPATYVFVIIGSVMATVALINYSTDPYVMSDVGFMRLGIEAVVFGVLNALPTVMIMLDRGEKNGKRIATDTGVMGAAFAVGHVLLQLGGFYKSLGM